MINYFTLSNLYSLVTLLIDVSFVAVVIYYCLKIVKNNTKTIQIFKGIIFFFLANGLAQLLGLKTIEYFTNQVISWGFLAVIIIFQPEIRSLLEKLGKTTVFSSLSTLTSNERERLVNELVKTSESLSKNKTGAIISIEQGQSLSEFISTGTAMNSVVSSELLCSIFQYGTPLHDGAVIIQGDKIACASAYFPPTTKDFPSSYGARHRAAVGISEINDCVTLVISEESGKVSVAKDGKLIVMDTRELREYLLKLICENKPKEEDSTADNQNQVNKLKINFKTKPKKNKKFEKQKIDKHDDKIAFEKMITPKSLNTKEMPKKEEEGGEL